MSMKKNESMENRVSESVAAAYKEAMTETKKFTGVHEIINLLTENGVTVDEQFAEYIAEIAKSPLLTEELESELCEIISKGCDGDEDAAKAADEAKNTLIMASLRFVMYISNKYANHPRVSLLTFIDHGNKAIVQAIEKYFSKDRDYKYSEFVIWFISNSMPRVIAEKAYPTPVPYHMIDTVQKVEINYEMLSSELEREATADEIVERTKLPLDRVERCLAIIKGTLSPNSDGEDEDHTLRFIPETSTDKKKTLSDYLDE